MKPATDTIHRIYDWDGSYLQVGQDADNGDLVEITAPGEKGRVNYGDLRLVLPPDMARALAEALVSAASAADKRRNELLGSDH